MENTRRKIFQKKVLPSLHWLRLMNETHGQIRAFIDTSNDRPTPNAVCAYWARTTNGTKYDKR